MAEYNINQSSTTSMNTAVKDYSVTNRYTDGVSEYTDETYYDNANARKWLGYYKSIPELKKAIDALAIWTSGKGHTTNTAREQVILESLIGWGEDTFESILNNLIVCKKVYGDAFAEIIRDEDGVLINIKVLDPAVIRIVVDKKGLIKRYEQYSKSDKTAKPTKFKPNEILHLCNDRIADEIHGVSSIEACQWVIDARNEAMTNHRKLLRRNLALGILYIDTEDTTKRNALMTQYQNAVNNGEVLVLPKGVAELKDANITIQDPISWIRYLENFFYQALGIPKVILGGSEEFTEASSKIGYLTFEQVYSKEQRELEADLWNQIGIRIVFNKPASIKNELLQSEDKNTGQIGFQPKETTATMMEE